MKYPATVALVLCLLAGCTSKPTPPPTTTPAKSARAAAPAGADTNPAPPAAKV